MFPVALEYPLKWENLETGEQSFEVTKKGNEYTYIFKTVANSLPLDDEVFMYLSKLCSRPRSPVSSITLTVLTLMPFGDRHVECAKGSGNSRRGVVAVWRLPHQMCVKIFKKFQSAVKFQLKSFQRLIFRCLLAKLLLLKNLRKASQSKDQQLKGNLSLYQSIQNHTVVRVVRGSKGSSKYAPADGYRYDVSKHHDFL